MLGLLVAATALIRSEWRAGNRATSLAIALLPIWFFLAIAVLFVAGWIDLALGIPGPSDAGKTIGVFAFVAFFALLFGGPVWSLRRLSKSRADRGPSVAAYVGGVDLGMNVRAGGINLGRPDNVLGCATLLAAGAMFIVGWGLLIIVGDVYKAVGGIPPEVFPAITTVGVVLFIGLGFVFPFVGTVFARRAIRRWIARQGLE